MKKTKHFSEIMSHTQRILLLIMSCILVMTCVWSSYAAYVSRSYVKGVAASPKQAINISSDYLSVVSKTAQEANYPVRKVILDTKLNSDSSPYTISFYIENTNGGIVSTKRIEYLIRIKGLTNAVGQLQEGIEIYYNGNKLSGENLTKILSDSGYQPDVMRPYTETIHVYKIVIPQSLISSVTDIKVIAVPTADSDDSGNMLAANIQPSIVGSVATFSYQGTFSDMSNSNYPYDFAAFNYEISVTSATSDHTMVLKWDNEKLEIDPIWGTNSGELKITMNGEKNRHLIKFYRLVGRNQNDSWQQNWTAMNELISFSEKLE